MDGEGRRSARARGGTKKKYDEGGGEQRVVCEHVRDGRWKSGRGLVGWRGAEG